MTTMIRIAILIIPPLAPHKYNLLFKINVLKRKSFIFIIILLPFSAWYGRNHSSCFDYRDFAMSPLKKVFAYTMLALAVGLPVAGASAMTIEDYDGMPKPDRMAYLQKEITKQIDAKKEKNQSVGQCLDDFFFKIKTNPVGVPDGVYLVMLRLDNSRQKDSKREVEKVISSSLNYLEREVCSKMQQAGKEGPARQPG